LQALVESEDAGEAGQEQRPAEERCESRVGVVG
jgi:hypothetical protein